MPSFRRLNAGEVCPDTELGMAGNTSAARLRGLIWVSLCSVTLRGAGHRRSRNEGARI